MNNKITTDKEAYDAFIRNFVIVNDTIGTDAGYNEYYRNLKMLSEYTPSGGSGGMDPEYKAKVDALWDKVFPPQAPALNLSFTPVIDSYIEIGSTIHGYTVNCNCMSYQVDDPVVYLELIRVEPDGTSATVDTRGNHVNPLPNGIHNIVDPNDINTTVLGNTVYKVRMTTKLGTTVEKTSTVRVTSAYFCGGIDITLTDDLVDEALINTVQRFNVVTPPRHNYVAPSDSMTVDRKVMIAYPKFNGNLTQIVSGDMDNEITHLFNIKEVEMTIGGNVVTYYVYINDTTDPGDAMLPNEKYGFIF